MHYLARQSKTPSGETELMDTVWDNHHRHHHQFIIFIESCQNATSTQIRCLSQGTGQRRMESWTASMLVNGLKV